jgi:hypothetical protein
MGGDIWQWRRYPVESAKKVDLIHGFQGFVFFDEAHTKTWNVHHVETGGLLGEASTELEAVYEANNNIKTTPDLKEQMKKLGDTSKFSSTTFEIARKRIAHSK